MKLVDQLRNRYNILAIIIAILMLVLFFRLATLTVVRGEELRKASDEKRVRELSITAPRGEIRDRYGRLLAGNKPSFTVQVLKDEFNNKSIDRNAILLTLVNILDEEGEDYTDELPIILNTFYYPDEYDYMLKAKVPIDKIAEMLLSNNLIGELLEAKYTYMDEDHNYRFLIGQRAKNVLLKSGTDVPIEVFINETGQVEFIYDESNKTTKWLEENNVDSTTTAKDALIQLVAQDEYIVRKMLSNAIVRKLAFDVLEKNGLTNGMYLSKYSLIYDEEYWDIKGRLIEQYDDITETTTAKEDFITIAKKEIAGELLNSVIIKTKEDTNTFVIPAEKLIERLKEKNIEVPIEVSLEVSLTEENDELDLKYTDEKKMKDILRYTGINENEVKRIISLEDKNAACIETLLLLEKEFSLLDDIIAHNDIKGFAQTLILNKGINPEITIKNWEYLSQKEKMDWLDKYKIPVDSSVEDAFKSLTEKYDIDEKLSLYEARGILVMIEQLNKQGYKAYEPIKVAYGIENKTVARIEENNMELQGIQVSVEPVRYYPNGHLAAHTLGYMGKISQPSEIKQYMIERDDYSLNDIIGKTGIEQKYEEYLNGEDGTRRVEVDAFGNTIKVFKEDPAKPGDNVYLTIDAELQRVAEASLKHALEEIQVSGEFQSKWGNYDYKDDLDLSYATSGAVVAIDVKTGEVLAIASYPAYDPNLFLPAGISTPDWESLKPENEEDHLAPRPLRNIAIQTPVQPGSIYKMIPALAALEKGLDPEFKIRDKGYVVLDPNSKPPACWLWNSSRRTHGYENVYDAIRDSCNYYFYSLMIGESEKYDTNSPIKLELSELIELSKKFGLDERTGIEIPGEKSGSVPNEKNQGEAANNDLRKFLSDNRAILREEVVTDEEIELIINHAYGWANDEQTYTKGKINNKLNELGLGLQIHTPLKHYSGKYYSLSDYITFTYLKNAKFQIGNWLNISIGQGENSYTPIQMTSYIATLADNGNKHKVSIVDEVRSYDDTFEILNSERETENLGLNQDNISAVLEGMRRVTAPGGTAYRAFKNFPVEVAGKTGTAQNTGVIPGTDGREYDNYAWFVAYAPYDDPQIAVTTLIFQGGSGGYGAPIAREIIAEYLGLNSDNEDISFDNKLVR